MLSIRSRLLTPLGPQGSPPLGGALGPQGSPPLGGALGPQGSPPLGGALGPQGSPPLGGALGPQGSRKKNLNKLTLLLTLFCSCCSFVVLFWIGCFLRSFEYFFFVMLFWYFCCTFCSIFNLFVVD